MKSIAAAFVIALVLTGSGLAVEPVAADGYGTVTGTITSARNVPVVGLTVYLAHPRVGRSRPAYTDMYGQFRIASVPIEPDPYYLEVNWDDDLVYWKRVSVQGYTPVAPITVGN